ncbi:MAG: cupin-like domain-containing protein [Myxococcota bacterium]
MDTVERIDKRQFDRDYVNKGRPVIITNDEATRKLSGVWTLDYIAEKHAGLKVGVEYYQDGHRDGVWEIVPMELSEFVSRIRSGQSKEYYLGEALLEEALPNIVQDFQHPAFLEGRKILKTVMFAGVDTFTGCHYHSSSIEAILMQLVGDKKFIMYDTKDFYDAEPRPWYSLRHTYSKRQFDLQGAPGNAITCTVRAGEILFIPQGWFHAVEGLSESVSITTFFRGPWTGAPVRILARDYLHLGVQTVAIRPGLQLVRRLPRLRSAAVAVCKRIGLIEKHDMRN